MQGDAGDFVFYEETRVGSESFPQRREDAADAYRLAGLMNPARREPPLVPVESCCRIAWRTENRIQLRESPTGHQRQRTTETGAGAREQPGHLRVDSNAVR